MNKFGAVFFLLFYNVSVVFGVLPEKIRVAAILDETEDEKHKLAFEYGVERVNRQLKLLKGKKLEAQVVRIPKDDSYKAEKAVCRILEKGLSYFMSCFNYASMSLFDLFFHLKKKRNFKIRTSDLNSVSLKKVIHHETDNYILGAIAIFGPSSDSNANHIRSLTDSMEIPFIDSRWNLQTGPSYGGSPDFAINLHPDISTLGASLVDLIKQYGWDSLTILYEDNASVIKLQALFDHTWETIPPEQLSFTLRQLTETPDEGYREILREIFRTKAKYILLDCRQEILGEVLKQAQQIGMMSEDYFFLLTNLDAHTIDFEDFKHGGTNFTTFRLIDTSKLEVQSVIRSIVTTEITKGNPLKISQGYLDTHTALMYDSVHLFAFALSELMSTQDISINRLSCDTDQSWQHGSSLINYMKMIEFKGLSGMSKFDTQGKRTFMNLDILELQKVGMVPVGSWNSVDGLNMSREVKSAPNNNPTNVMANKTFIVTLIENAPYTMLKEEIRRLEGNDRFEGFAIDLITEISKVLHFNFTLKLVDDDKYGSQDEHGNWNGMIKEVLMGPEEGGADFAVADLSITTSRASAVLFSMPWMNLGISIIYIKPRPAPPDLLSFLSPFTLEVWIHVGLAFMLVSLVLYVLARFSPYEWDNPYPCIEEPEELETQFNIANSFWFTVGSIMQQGSDVAPIATSTRLVAGMWYFFALIMISSYTANLAAFLTVETLERPIESAEDLAKQTKVQYGVVSGGSTMNFFKTSSFETYQKMWDFMSGEHQSEVMVSSNKDGIDKVIEADGAYAFMMESSSIEYIIERKCTVSQVGGLLDNKGYGIATAPGTPFKNLLDTAILELQEGGVLFKLKTKWWKRKRGGGACNNVGGGGGVAELGLPNVAGVFLVTIFGCLAAIVSSFLELLYGARVQSEELGTTWWTEIKEEIKFAFKCHGTSKAVRKPIPDSSSESSGGSSKYIYKPKSTIRKRSLMAPPESVKSFSSIDSEKNYPQLKQSTANKTANPFED